MLDDVGAPTLDRALVQMKIVDLPDDAPVEAPEIDQDGSDEDPANLVDEQ